MKIKELADLVGLSVRTLRHYDALGLLKPHQISAAGYLLYSADNLAQLQQILFFRELGFPLAQIKSIVNDLGFDRLQALEQHQRLLLKNSVAWRFYCRPWNTRFRMPKENARCQIQKNFRALMGMHRHRRSNPIRKKRASAGGMPL